MAEWRPEDADVQIHHRDHPDADPHAQDQEGGTGQISARHLRVFQAAVFSGD